MLICVDPSNHEVTSCDTSHLFPPRAYWKVQQNFIITKMWRTSRCYRSYGFKKLQKNLILFTTSMLRSTCQCSEIIQPIKSLILCCKVCSANPGCLCVPLVIGFYSLCFFCPLFSSRIYSGGCFQYFKHFLIRMLYWSGKIIWLQCSSTNRSHGNRICSETSYVWGERSTRPSLTEKRVFKESISKRYRPTGTILFLHIWSFGWIFGFILNLDHCVKTQEKNKNSCTNMCRTLWFFFWFWLKSSTDCLQIIEIQWKAAPSFLVSQLFSPENKCCFSL